MRLPDFIFANVETIVKEWASIAADIWPERAADSLIMHGHAADILIAVAAEMNASRTHPPLAGQSNRLDDDSRIPRGISEAVDGMADPKAMSGLGSGFQVSDFAVEYRALRDSAIKLWVGSLPEPGFDAIHDIIRINEVIDHFLAASIESIVLRMDATRECLLRIIGHDLRNPLTAATMIAYLLEEATAPDSQSMQMVATLRASLSALDQLICNLHDFTGSLLGTRMTATFQRMDLLLLCREVLDEMKAAHTSRTFIFISPRERELIGDWDDERLRQLIKNLLENAVQHGFDASPITLTATCTDLSVRLGIHNFGPSIPEESLGAIFDPIKRRQSSESGVPVGTVGLGLYIAREVAMAHGGTIDVTSAQEETLFSVHLPRHFPDSPASAENRLNMS